MRQLIAGNWKMNGLTADAEAFGGELRARAGGLACDLLVCPPFTQIARLAGLLAGTGIGVGGQDCHAEPQGAHTGDISADMLADLGCTAIIVGHSERRQAHGETDAQICAKALAAMRAGLLPIVCVGETEAERDAGREAEVVGHQLAASLPPGFEGVVAYEPIWAIGTGRIATTTDVATIHRHIRKVLVERLGDGGRTLRILYGGSVRPENASELLATSEVGGVLVGGASLAADSLLAIARAAVAGLNTI